MMSAPVRYAEAKIEVERLVERFARLTAHNRRRYNEPATRQEFILPFFRNLGWNIEDTREVSPEERVSRGYVDFAFRLGGIPRFFLETKKIPENLDDPRWAQQAINYAWLKGVTWAVLTDFEGLKVFNAEWQETIPARAIFKDLYWEEYLDRFDDLWLLSRPAMEEGALDRAAEAVGRKVKRTPVNRQLFADLTEWRRELFRHLRPYNPRWSIEQIDQAVQRILDRLIFIRTCEDREIEPPLLQPLWRQWHDQGRRGDLVAELNRLFHEFDATYDTLLFAPHFCEELKSEPTPFEMVIQGLHDVPGGYGFYDFNAIDADVLGTIYEQYLGHRAQDPEGRQVVDRRAKRKAQGIYYTPQFVVRYIVGQTLGRLLEERGYEQARQVKVLDMACGSGSFLIEAFDVLDRYLAGVRGQNTPLSRSAGEGPGVRAAGDIHDFARRMEILTGNLYGVDLDAQAVEIARLNLLLKAVNQRGELPRLDNIRQGNSLISGTSEELEAAFGPHWRDKHPFNWEEQFPRIMEQGGFDVIVGNPPYVPNTGFSEEEKAYHRARFESAVGKYDLYMLFTERALGCCKPDGYFGFIIPNKFMQTRSGKGLRSYILEHSTILEILDFGDTGVFQGTTNYPCILILKKTPATEAHTFRFARVNGLPDNVVEEYTVRQAELSDGIWVFARKEALGLYERLLASCDRLSDWVERFFTGIQSGADKILVFDERQANSLGLDRKLLRPVLRGRDIKRFLAAWGGKSIYFPYILDSGEYRLLTESERSSFYNWSLYLAERRSRLERRVWFGENAEQLSGAWYGLMYVGDPRWFDQRKIITPALSSQPNFTLDEEGYLLFTGTAGGYGLILRSKHQSRESHLFLLGVLNSRVIDFCIRRVSPMFSGGFFKYNTQYMEDLPVPKLNFDDPADVARHNRMVALVEEMLRLQKEHAEAEALKEDRRHDLARRIERLDRQIDAMVYELYGLTEEEIGVVEGKG